MKNCKFGWDEENCGDPGDTETGGISRQAPPSITEDEETRIIDLEEAKNISRHAARFSVKIEGDDIKCDPEKMILAG